MKVIILHRNSFDVIGGVESTIYYMAKELNNLGFEAIVVAKKRTDSVQQDNNNFCKVIRYKPSRYLKKATVLFHPYLEYKNAFKDLKNIIVQIEPVPYTTLYTYERGHSKALGGYYDFSLKDALRNKQLTVQLSFPSGSTTKEIDLHSQLEQVLKNSELPDGWYILNQNNDFPKEVHIDGNQIRSN